MAARHVRAYVLLTVNYFNYLSHKASKGVISHVFANKPKKKPQACNAMTFVESSYSLAVDQ